MKRLLHLLLGCVFVSIVDDYFINRIVKETEFQNKSITKDIQVQPGKFSRNEN